MSVFKMFSVGLGPSSSHTVGPMRAAHAFLQEMIENDLISSVERIKVDLYGSLALTGKGHATDVAVQLGLLGFLPEDIDPQEVPKLLDKITVTQQIQLHQTFPVPFKPIHDLLFHKNKFLPFHPNALQITCFGPMRQVMLKKTYYSVGGGFIVDHDERNQRAVDPLVFPFPFRTGKELLQMAEEQRCSIPELIRKNERTYLSDKEIRDKALSIWQVMQESIERGMEQTGELPGGLHVPRRAKRVHEHLLKKDPKDPGLVLDWVSLFALAVNEENAAGGRIVTAPTNGASGVVPAVLKYYTKLTSKPTEEGIIDFLLTAGAIGVLFKEGASISAAEMGCMGEVGVACSMAAAGLTAALGGSNLQIENAAEIGMEHHLGLTCDPVRGLVQIPCIERNTMGALQAINASRLAMSQEESGIVRLDQVINTMRETGRNMQSIYKETSLGGLAVNVPEC